MKSSGHSGSAFQNGTRKLKLSGGCFYRQGKCSRTSQKLRNLLLILPPWLLEAFEFETLYCTGYSLEAFGWHTQFFFIGPVEFLAVLFHLLRNKEWLLKYALESPPSFHASSLPCLGGSSFSSFQTFLLYHLLFEDLPDLPHQQVAE